MPRYIKFLKNSLFAVAWAIETT